MFQMAVLFMLVVMIGQALTNSSDGIGAAVHQALADHSFPVFFLFILFLVFRMVTARR